MQHCLLCNKTGRTFNIFEDWNGKHTIRDDLLEIFGMVVEPHLREVDVLCNQCMNIMENFAKLKRRLLPIIIDRTSRSYDRTPIKFGKLWDLFASFTVEDESDTLMSCPSPSPSLLKYSHSKPYHDALETKIAAREGARQASRRLNLSRASAQYYSDTCLNREVSEINTRKRKKKRGKRNLWTRRKRKTKASTSGASSFRFSSLTNYRITPVEDSDDSDLSYQSFYLPRARPDTTTTTRSISSLKYEEGKLLNKRTRSVSRAQEEEAYRIAEEEMDAMIFYCNFSSCVDKVYDDLDVYTFHKQSKHRCMALYTCDMGCTQKYITKDDLELHMRLKHDCELLLCSMCGIDVFGPRELQKHINEHLAYSVGCIYCDKYFLDKKHRDDHVKEYHKGKKRRIKQKHPDIIDRIDKADSDDDYSESEPSSPIPFDKKPFCIRVVTPDVSSRSEQCRTEDENPTVISLFGQFIRTTPITRPYSTNIDLENNSTSSIHSASVDISDSVSDSVDNATSDPDEADAVESLTETNTVDEDVVQSDSVSEYSILSEESESTMYVSVDSLEKDDKLFTKCLKVVLTDCLRVPPSTVAV